MIFKLMSACVPTCSAGVGRTGTFIALDICLKQAKSNFVVEVPTTVKRMRCQRMNLVQTLVSINVPVYWETLLHQVCPSCTLHVGPIHIHPRCFVGAHDVWRHANQCK